MRRIGRMNVRRQLLLSNRSGLAVAEKGFNNVSQGARGFLANFRDFMFQDEVVNLAIGIIIGTAFVEVIDSVVKDLIGPVLALCGSGGTMTELFFLLRAGNDSRSQYVSVEQAKAAGAITLNVGKFIENMIDFLILSLCVFFVMKVVLALKFDDKAELGGLRKPTHCLSSESLNGEDDEADIEEEAEPELYVECSACCEPVNARAIRCPHCHAAQQPLQPRPLALPRKVARHVRRTDNAAAAIRHVDNQQQMLLDLDGKRPVKLVVHSPPPEPPGFPV